MKIIEMKLKESLIKWVKEIPIDESHIIWIEAPKAISQKEFQKLQDIISESFPLNRVIVVPKGCKLKFENLKVKEDGKGHSTLSN